ncbi:MAG: hypothetical protein GAK29_01511 [Acinetobacter bereziniae]|uniref:Uncharacterized protein n=1 Tax=Acinetobacter bereziniae TaxID=106648 RepID=A0A833PGV6_ACIBZ|nr:MAG: hypothetical protein GAK29_01511 [Acinetobacter bereziniae]
MNKPNLPQHPCANKCTDFKGEQCKTCLVQQIEKRELELGVAPDEAYVKTDTSDFLPDDVVVKIFGDDDTLYVFAMQSEINPDYGYIGEPDAEQGECIALADIRHATVAEIQAKRRLTEAEQALAEVS